MDKATLLLAAASTLRRRFAVRLGDAATLSAQILDALAKTALFVATMFTWVGLATDSCLRLLPLLPLTDDPGWIRMQMELDDIHGAMTARGWTRYVAVELAAWALILWLANKDAGLGASHPLPAGGLARFNARLSRPWTFLAALLEKPAMEGNLLGYPLKMGKTLLQGVSMPIQLATLAWTIPSSWAVGIFSGAAALARSGPAAALALERLAQESPEVIAKHEAKALGTHAKPGKAADKPPRL